MSDRKLVLSVTLKDCEVQHFRCGGPGGQKLNKTDFGSRVIHRASGARGESREHREQSRNTKSAFARMVQTPTFQAWLKLQLGQDMVSEARVAERVRTDMRSENILVEFYDPS